MSSVYKVFIGILLAVIMGLGTLSIKQWITNSRLEVDNNNLNIAVQEYDAMVQVIPYNVLNQERGGKAHEEINATINSNKLLIGNDWM